MANNNQVGLVEDQSQTCELKPVLPINSNKICEKIYNAGIVNYARETAIFIASYINPNDKNTMIYKFFTNSTLLADWEKNMSRIEIYGYIVKGIKKLGNNKILLCLTKEDLSSPKPKIWNNNYLQKEYTIFVYKQTKFDLWKL